MGSRPGAFPRPCCRRVRFQGKRSRPGEPPPAAEGTLPLEQKTIARQRVTNR